MTVLLADLAFYAFLLPRLSVGLHLADWEAFQRAVRQQDLAGLACLLSHGRRLDQASLGRLLESCGPRCVRDCLLEAVASARLVARMNVL